MEPGETGDETGTRRWWHGHGAMWTVTACGVALGLGTTFIAANDPGADPFRVTVHAIGGMLFLTSGLLAHHRRTTNRVGPLMAAAGVGFFSEDLQLSPVPWIHTIGQLTVAASGGFLVHLVLAFPTGRLRSRPQRALITVAYGGAAGTGLLNALFVDLHSRIPGNPVGLLLIVDSPFANLVIRDGSRLLAAVIAAGLIVVLAHRWITANALMRSLLAPAITVMLAGGLVSAVGLVFRYQGDLHDSFVRAYDVVFAALPLALLAGMVYFYLGRGAVNRLLRQLRAPMGTAEIQELLARSLRDESLRVAFRTDAGLVDDRGAALDVTAERPPRAVTVIEHDGRRAVLVHDPLLCEDPHVLESVAAATGLALTNQALSEQVAGQLAEVRASRARLVEAADTERRRIERDLHDGAQQRLVTALLGVQLARRRFTHDDPATVDLLSGVADGLTAALTEIRELAHGLHPVILTEAGLSVAIEDLAGRLPLDTETDVASLPRFAPNIESAAYFVVAEALTNALKHSRATRVRVRVRHVDGLLSVSVGDDGRGGADISGGSGLQGLLDRVAALGGTLVVTGPAGAGTTVEAVLPVDIP
ncbi:histidine kinase [Streptosporangium sp. NPDC051022]|uniref:sensor histidine kinase n=1 Tax=Streptosporangium sp. NPDC051022 TaxID=3155752 RepID=UPI00342274CB